VAEDPGESRERFEREALAHAEHLYRIALRLTGSPQEAEDLVQETYLRALRSWRRFIPESNLAAWLATILRNAYLDAVRRESRRPREEPLDDEASDYELYNRIAGGARGPQEQVLDRLAGAEIGAAVDALPEQYREAIALVDIGEFTYQEAADIAGVPIGTIMSRLHRGRRLLKRELAERAVKGGTG
jgi:RNA polymerase sigma-70 factor (ECF subfamily)